jgi:hypothetical protein
MGNRIEPVLKMTSVTASSARACTLEFLTSRHQNQHRPLMAMVPIMMAMAGMPSSTSSCSGAMSRWADSKTTWVKEVIMMTEKTSTPRGSNRRLPTGYWYWSCLLMSHL